jgi:hypothetical protein
MIDTSNMNKLEKEFDFEISALTRRAAHLQIMKVQTNRVYEIVEKRLTAMNIKITDCYIYNINSRSDQIDLEIDVDEDVSKIKEKLFDEELRTIGMLFVYRCHIQVIIY